MAKAATGILNQQLDSYENTRIKLNDSVDTAEEVGRLCKLVGATGSSPREMITELGVTLRAGQQVALGQCRSGRSWRCR